MVVNQLSRDAMQQLYTQLEQMDVCARELEEIARLEHEAIRSLNADQIIAMADRRILAHEALAQLEQQCRTLIDNQGISSDLTLEVIIDMHAGSQAAEFQALRRNLYNRMMQVDKASQENRLRMLAAYNVSSSILQQLGLTQAEQTYSRRTGG